MLIRFNRALICSMIFFLTACPLKNHGPYSNLTLEQLLGKNEQQYLNHEELDRFSLPNLKLDRSNLDIPSEMKLAVAGIQNGSFTLGFKKVALALSHKLKLGDARVRIVLMRWDADITGECLEFNHGKYFLILINQKSIEENLYFADGSMLYSTLYHELYHVYQGVSKAKEEGAKREFIPSVIADVDTMKVFKDKFRQSQLMLLKNIKFSNDIVKAEKASNYQELKMVFRNRPYRMACYITVLILIDGKDPLSLKSSEEVFELTNYLLKKYHGKAKIVLKQIFGT